MNKKIKLSNRISSMPSVAQRDLEADVAHHGRDDGVALAAGPRPSAACAHISITASPSTTRPRSSTKIARSPSPSNATPSWQPPLDDRRRPAAPDASSRTRRLMFRPSGSVADHDRRRTRAREQLAAPRSSWRRWRNRRRACSRAAAPASGQIARRWAR